MRFQQRRRSTGDFSAIDEEGNICEAQGEADGNPLAKNTQNSAQYSDFDSTSRSSSPHLEMKRPGGCISADNHGTRPNRRDEHGVSHRFLLQKQARLKNDTDPLLTHKQPQYCDMHQCGIEGGAWIPTYPYCLNVLSWLPKYPCCDLWTLPSDLIAGLTVGVMAVPQSLSYAGVAGLAPEYGLYSR